MVDSSNEVLFEEIVGRNGHIGLITLNRSASMNYLNHAMVLAISTRLQNWSTARHIKAVIIRAAENAPAFCAGGDLIELYEYFKKGKSLTADFFHDEYRMNRLIFHYPKPYIALLDGITMGGGAGLSVYGSHRVVTGKLTFAMPETKIGFFPDAGGTYFLSRLPGEIGTYLGLTGSKIGSDDCITIGIATQKVTSYDLTKLINTLAESDLGENPLFTVTKIIEEFKAPANPSRLIQHRNQIDACFSGATVENVLENLQKSSNQFCSETMKLITTRSPISLKVTLRALREAKKLDFDKCMFQEFRILNRFLQTHDLIEGIRAIMIDKDQKPKWQPNSISDVTLAEIEKFFLPLTQELY